MGYSTRSGTEITDFWPDDTDTELYLSSSTPIPDIIDLIDQKWPGSGFSLGNFEISAEHIHTECIWYDLHDPSDYTTFIKITKKETNV
jgi:hypothetical protein